MWPRSPPPAPGLEQPFQVLASSDEQADHVDLGEATEAELAEAVPLFRLAEQRLDPDAALAHRPLVGSRLVVAADAVQVFLVEAAGEDPSFLAVGTLRFERTGVAGAGRCWIGPRASIVVVASEAQHGAVLAGVDVLLLVVRERLGAEEAGPLAHGGERHVGPDAGLCQGADVVDGPMGRVADRSLRVEVPAEPCSPQQVLERGVLHDVGRGHQHAQDDAGLPAVDDVVVVVAQGRCAAIGHGGCVGVGRTYAQVGQALIAFDGWPIRIEPSLLEEPPALGPLDSQAGLVLRTEPGGQATRLRVHLVRWPWYRRR